MGPDEHDALVRAAAFAFLEDLTARSPNGILDRATLARGLELGGRRVPLLGPEGIFKPAVLPEMPLSITTVPVKEGRPRPYEDRIESEGLLYRYRRGDPQHPDNAGLRTAMSRQVPLIYFHGLVPGKYLAAWPAYIVGDDPASLTFRVALDDRRVLGMEDSEAVAEGEAPTRRRYVTRTTVQRLHQEDFRARVLRAYRESCAVCRLRHAQLLDAAHILPDGHPRGEPWVSNGLSLCKIHHAAFDAHFLGIRPDLQIEIRHDILREKDGPLLQHGLQELHGKRLLVIPRATELRPREDFLLERYRIFRAAG
jgi:putative restriction endonuclease